MAAYLCHAREPARAEALARATHRARAARAGEADAATLRSLHRVAACVGQAGGRLEEAERLYRDALRQQAATLGEAHADALSTGHDLACAALSPSPSSSSRARASATRGCSHAGARSIARPRRTSRRYNLKHQHKYVEAERVYRSVLAGRAAALGPEHRDTLLTMANLAALLSKTGRDEEALELTARCHAARRATLGLDHPDTLTAANNLALTLKKAGRLGEAEPLLRAAYEGRAARLGADHPDTVTAYGNLQACLAELKRKRKR